MTEDDLAKAADGIAKGINMGSFIAVLLVVAVCIAAYKVLTRKVAPKADPIGGGGSQRNPVPPAKS